MVLGDQDWNISKTKSVLTVSQKLKKVADQSKQSL
jgi:hypothetical protein